MLPTSPYYHVVLIRLTSSVNNEDALGDLGGHIFYKEVLGGVRGVQPIIRGPSVIINFFILS